jgi:hypothetical protein
MHQKTNRSFVRKLKVHYNSTPSESDDLDEKVQQFISQYQEINFANPNIFKKTHAEPVNDIQELLRLQAIEIFKTENGETSSHKRLDYDPMPNRDIDKKYDYFYLPYSYNHGLERHFNFEEVD